MSVFNILRNEKEELIQQLEAELQWVTYRMRMFDIIEEKLLQMKRMAEIAKESNFSLEEIESINVEIHNLEEQVKALDSESRNLEDDKIL